MAFKRLNYRKNILGENELWVMDINYNLIIGEIGRVHLAYE